MMDAVGLELFNHRFSSICEEMGASLRRSAVSPNIRERLDFSCALFDAAGEMVAQAAHIPVHLGSMPASVAAVLAELELGPGDVALLNDPYRGGTHLPDVTVVAPLFIGVGERPELYVANRAHHADIGGAAPGSMAPSREIYQEGLIIPPVRLVRDGELERDLLELILRNLRAPRQRRSDLEAQLAAARTGLRRLGRAAALKLRR